MDKSFSDQNKKIQKFVFNLIEHCSKNKPKPQLYDQKPWKWLIGAKKF